MSKHFITEIEIKNFKCFEDGYRVQALKDKLKNLFKTEEK